jgi:REP element-mobilizing transposase RayT
MPFFSDMKLESDVYHRRSIRLKEYDYSQPGACSVTICTQERQCLFGDVSDEEMMLNDVGHLAWQVCDELPRLCSTIELDQFVVMSNHLHDIIFIQDRETIKKDVATIFHVKYFVNSK